MIANRRYVLLSLFKLFDLGLLVGSFIAAAIPSLSEVGATSLSDFLSMRISVRNFVLFACLLLLWHLLFLCFGLYESKRFSNQHREDLDVLKATSLGTFVLLELGIPFHLSVIHPRFLLVFWAVSTISAVAIREAIRLVLKRMRQHGRNLRHVLIVGTNPRAVQLARPSKRTRRSAIVCWVLSTASGREWKSFARAATPVSATLRIFRRS